MKRAAWISKDGVYRYSLVREWGEPPHRWCCMIGLNPSVADAEIDDPTIRREVDFAKQLGCTALVKVNHYAFRATDPKVLLEFVKKHGQVPARGSENLVAIRDAIHFARATHGVVVAAWGSMPMRLRPVRSWTEQAFHDVPMVCLGRTKDGSPRHPLYLPKNAQPMEYTP